MAEEFPKAWRSDHFEQFQYPARGVAKPVFPKSASSITGAGKNVRSIAWSCDGRRVATGTELKGIRVWNAKATIESGSSFPLPDSSSKPSPHNGHVGALAFSPTDPNLLVSGCKSAAAGGCIVIWDISRPREAVKRFQIAGDVLHIAFHPSGRQFAVVCPRARRDEVYFYHLALEDGKEVWSQREDVMLGGPGSEVGYDEINSLRFHPNGQFVLYVSNDGTINAWEFPEFPLPDLPELPEKLGVEKDVQEGETSRPRSPREQTRTPEPQEERTDGEGGDVEMESKEPEKPHGAEDGTEGSTVRGEAEGGDEEKGGASEAGGEGDDDEAKPSEAATTEQDVEMGNVAAAATAAPSAAPTRPASPAANGTVQPEASASEAPIKKAKQLVRFRSQYCGNSVLLGLNLDPLGRYVVTGGGDCRAVVYNMEDWLPFRAYTPATGTIRHVAFSPDGELIALGGDSNSDIYIVSIFSSEVIGQYKINAMVVSLAWHPQKNWLAWATLSKTNIPMWYLVKQD